jgi:(1->4)-alpha-D-glucan 1-alpha-D-glucosylmutase
MPGDRGLAEGPGEYAFCIGVAPMPIPRATYRLQLRPDFDFDEAAAVLDYVRDLGVSHVYASPYLQASAGSTHGYDVVDPTRVNRDLGGEEGHQRFCDALSAAGLGQVLDIVPNHMAITGPENRWWFDVLRNGPASAFASYFDVDWDPPEAKLRDTVLMPILGDHYGRELEAGTIALEHDGGVFHIRYHDHLLPVAPRSLAEPLQRAAADGAPVSGSGAPDAAEPGAAAGRGPAEERDADRGAAALAEVAFLGRAYGRLPEASAELEPAVMEARQRDLDVLDRRLRALATSRPAVAEALDGMVAAINRDVDALDRLVSEQNYRLAYWRIAGQELDYRRFFDITSLAGLRTERPAVFRAVHGRVLEWLRAGVLDGVRVDHPDGMCRPGEYFGRLRAAAPDAWIVVEKILMPDESLPDWPVAGTTGYEVLNDIGGLFVDPAGEAPFTELWREVAGDDGDFHQTAYEARKHVMRDVLAADLHRLANIFVQVCERRRRHRDFARGELREALAEVAAAFPVYRTYVTEGNGAAAADAAVVARAVAAARTRRPELDGELLGLLESVLLGREDGPAARALRMRFQQFTGPVAAKGEEDTAFYRYLRFSPLNEVGGDPGRWGLDPATFHERSAARAREWPAAMTTLSTHDTKRSEDVRARLFTLSEIPTRWAEAVRSWRERSAAHWPRNLERDPAMEYLLYQTAVGAWPIDGDRLGDYMEKASREAKLRTSWTDPDPEYDEALARFVARLMASAWAGEVEGFVAPILAASRVVSLAQKLVQLTAPGVPDLYQGGELWDLSLVDPDNRRPVDFAERRALLDRLPSEHGAEPDPRAILGEMASGLPKLWVVRQALAARARHPHAFVGGGYQPLDVEGDAAEHAVGFVREGAVAVVVPRLVVRLVRDGGWRDTRVILPGGTWRNVLTGEVVKGGGRKAHELLGRFPVALLTREGDS